MDTSKLSQLERLKPGLSPESEIRISKSEITTNARSIKKTGGASGPPRIRNFPFRDSNLFRISIFGFRISAGRFAR